MPEFDLELWILEYKLTIATANTNAVIKEYKNGNN